MTQRRLVGYLDGLAGQVAALARLKKYRAAWEALRRDTVG